MAQNKNAFYARHPQIMPEHLLQALQAGYPSFKSYFRSERISFGAGPKGGKVIQLDKSSLSGVKISIDTDNMITVLPNMGSRSLGCLLGWSEFLFLDWKLTANVSDYLKANFGETRHLHCGRCNLVYPSYYNACNKCRSALAPYPYAN